MSPESTTGPTRTVRCPFCLAPHTMPAETPPTSARTCENCKRSFAANKALPYRQSANEKRQTASTLPRLLKQLGLILGGIGLLAAGAWFAWGAWTERHPSEEQTQKRASADNTAVATAGDSASVQVILYGGTLRGSDRGPVLVPFTAPSLAMRGDKACDAKEKSPLAWELERGEGEQGLRIPVSLIVNGERVTDLPKDFTEGRLTLCRLPIDDGVRAVRLKLGETPLFSVERPIEPIYFVESTANALPDRRIAIAWRTRPIETTAILTQALPEQGRALVLDGLSSPLELSLDELPTLPKDVAFTLSVTDGFSIVSTPLAVREPKPEAPSTPPTDKSVFATVTGTWKVEGASGAPPPGERLCAVPEDSAGKRLCTEVVAGKPYTLDLVPASYRVCLSGTCDLCVLNLTPSRGATRDFKRVGGAFTFEPPAEGLCAPPEATHGERSPRFEATFQRTTRDANTGLSGVKFVIEPNAEVTRGPLPVTERLELAPGRHRFRIANPAVDLAELLWVDLPGGEEVEVHLDLLRRAEK